MIIFPQNESQWKSIAAFMQSRSGVDPSAGAKYMAWVEGKEIKVGVAFNEFMGNLCQIHVAMAKEYAYTPKEMLRETFQFAFDGLKRKKLVGVVSSLNEKALRFDTHLGFTEHTRFEDALAEGDDIIILTMTPEQCRYYKPHEPKEEKAA